MSIFGRRIGIGLGVLVALGIAGAAVLSYLGRRAPAGECSRTEISSTTSPDRAWRAVVREEVCSDGRLVTTDTDVVRLVREGGPQAIEGDVFSAGHFAGGVGGRDDTWPLVRWLGPRLLEIEVPNKALLGVSKEKFEDVVIRVKLR